MKRLHATCLCCNHTMCSFTASSHHWPNVHQNIRRKVDWFEPKPIVNQLKRNELNCSHDGHWAKHYGSDPQINICTWRWVSDKSDVINKCWYDRFRIQIHILQMIHFSQSPQKTAITLRLRMAWPMNTNSKRIGNAHLFNNYSSIDQSVVHSYTLHSLAAWNHLEIAS